MKKELKILGLSYSQSQEGSYIVVLSEKNGKRKLPIVVKPSDAQQIALKIEGLKSPRPLTHDLFKMLSDSYGIVIKEIYIYNILEGVFYTKIVTYNNNNEIDIECTAGDGISLSVVYNCPIYVDSEVLKVSGVYINDDGTTIQSSDIEEDPVDDVVVEKRIVSVEDLERMLEDALQNEEYEIAAKLRDRITKLRED